jgi:hypothetical protein
MNEFIKYIGRRDCCIDYNLLEKYEILTFIGGSSEFRKKL